VEVDAGGTVREFGAGRHFFTGVYAARRELLRSLPGSGFHELVRDLLRPLLPSGAVRAISHAGRWFDLGTPAAYLDAQFSVLDELVSGAMAVPEGSRLESRRGHPVLRHESAHLSLDAAVEGPVLLAEGARAGEGTRLAHAILLPRTILRDGEVLHDAIALDDLRVGVKA
jgi:mannose-1-phosphate guanylyltransferase